MRVAENGLSAEAQTPDDLKIDLCLQRRITDGDEISAIANAVVSMFQDINVRLTPIIGLKGVAALHRRGLLLTINKNTALAQPYLGMVVALDLSHFRSLLLAQAPIEATRFGQLLLKTTYGLLVTLIGSALCERLLYTVWEHPLSAAPAQEPQL